MQRERVLVTPVHGYGWRSADGALQDTPGPFAFVKETHADASDVLVGQVDTTEHPLHGQWVVLSRRSADHFNISVLSERPRDLRALLAQNDPALRLTGFAAIEDAQC